MSLLALYLKYRGILDKGEVMIELRRIRLLLKFLSQSD